MKALRILLFATLSIYTLISTAPTEFVIRDIDLKLVYNQTVKDAIIAKKKMDAELEAAAVSVEINKRINLVHKRFLDEINDENLKKLVENEIRHIYLSHSFAMKTKDDVIDQLQSKISQKTETVGSLNRSLAILTNFTRILACPANIRFTLEIAPTMMQSSPSKARRDTIISHLKNMTTTRINNCIQAINYLSSLAYEFRTSITVKIGQGSSSNPRNNDENPSTNGGSDGVNSVANSANDKNEEMNTKKNSKMTFSKAFSILKSSCINTNFSKITDGKSSNAEMISLVRDLVDSTDEDQARIKWNQEITPKWKQQPKKVITIDDSEDIRKLVAFSKQDLSGFQSNKHAPYFASRKEVNYANAILELDCLYSNSYNSEIEKTCIWILYTETERPEVQRIVSNLEKDWSSQIPNESRRIGIFCSKWLQLYNTVSVAFHHKPSLYPPLLECHPRSEDYEMFLEYLLVAYKDPFMIYVARSLMGITENYIKSNPKSVNTLSNT